uniref:Sodium-dependent nutrient amino acid transporter 1 n=1 Tax=Ixodes scapularis TaxID=6945 RepID=A0A1S4L6M1_IXOSC
GGLYILTLMDTFIGGEMLPWIGLAEILAVVFGYGIKRFCADVEFMMGDPPHFITRFCWRVTCPVCLAFIVLAAFVSYKPLTLGDYVFPEWAEYLGIFSAVMAIKIMIIFAVHHFYKCGFV